MGHVIPGSEVWIEDIATGKRCEQGECGEVIAKSPYNMKGYYRMEEATRSTISPDGALRTGDIGYFDADDCLHISARLKDMFIVGGVNAYPIEIENHIGTLEGVDEVEVVGVPDERLGEVACAFVIKAPGCTLAAQNVIDHCSCLANYKIPRYVRFVDGFPTTANGKVKKYVPREIFERETNS